MKIDHRVPFGNRQPEIETLAGSIRLKAQSALTCADLIFKLASFD
jgi:hypothetical protein